jgi:hypothetical protein
MTDCTLSRAAPTKKIASPRENAGLLDSAFANYSRRFAALDASLSSMGQKYSPLEQEVIILKSVWDAIDDMVNYRFFLKLSRVKEAELHFQDTVHQQLFNVLLVDLLSQSRRWPFGLPHPPMGSPKSQQNILYHLSRVSEAPMLCPDQGQVLKQPLEAFLLWLEGNCTVEDVWLPSIQLNISLTLKRIAFIKICGNIAKHGFTRLDQDVSEIVKILEANGRTVDSDLGYLVIPEFQEWFHDNVFSYHSSAIAEFLNNMRWGLYNYLLPEFRRPFTRRDGEIQYEFKVPADCATEVGRTMYWDLMNAVRSEPYMPQFEVTRFLKLRY